MILEVCTHEPGPLVRVRDGAVDEEFGFEE
jgi:hypothetical protein